MRYPVIIKKDGSREGFNPQKLVSAVNKSANRVGDCLTYEEGKQLIREVLKLTDCLDEVTVSEMHCIVEKVLAMHFDKEIYRSYSSYRDYKKRFNKSFDSVLQESKAIIYEGSKENANKDSQLISTKKELISGSFSKEMYLEQELPQRIAEAHKNGDIYIHDTSDRITGSINCCLFDMGAVLKDGFSLNGVHYTEPTSAESALRVISDIILQASSQQYGGFTVAELDKVLAPYVKKALRKSEEFYRRELPIVVSNDYIEKLAREYVERAVEQGLQAVETRLNTINNANGQTAFITVTFGLDTSYEGRMVSRILLENRMKGIGREGITPVFPKLVFLHRNGINGQEEDPNYDLYLLSIKCSLKRIYPDYLSLNEGYLGDIFNRYGLAISPMGCRAYLSPWFECGGMFPAYPEDKPVFVGRANCGAITLNTVRYAIEAQGDKKKYFEKLDYNFDLATEVHLLTYAQHGKIKASSNPLFFCEGGCHIRLEPKDPICKATASFTWSYGYIGLNEASLLMTGKQIHEDNSFAIEVLEHLNKRIEEAKEKYYLLFALYGTPAESLAFKFCTMDRNRYGVIEGVTDKDYYMNSFHVDVKAQVDPIQKQLAELPMFHLSNGGHIQYNEFPNTVNEKGVKQIVDFAMKNGSYFGVNVELDTCCDCGTSGEFSDYVCTECGSENITMIDRVCGYVSYRKLNGDTRYNAGKYEEVENRVDHFAIPVDVEE
jgi:anaerobic ribonucleoside-triphosphate reductase